MTVSPATVPSLANSSRRLPLLFRVVEYVRRALPGSATRFVYGLPFVPRLRQTLSDSAPAGPVWVTIAGGTLEGARFLVDLSCEKYYWLGTCENETQRFIAANVIEGATVYDVGAHAGFFTLLFSRCAGGEGFVYAFEPLPANVSRLQANLDANECANADVIAAAVSDEDGSAAFVASGSSLMGSLGGADLRTVEHVLPVQTRTIDAFVAGGARPPDVIKIDVEGAEGRVIRGAARTIEAHRPLILIEIHSPLAARETLDALPVPYEFQDLASGQVAVPPLSPGRYAARPVSIQGRP